MSENSLSSKKPSKTSKTEIEFDIGIFIFRRDLRVEDNRGLIKLSESCKNIIPIFIFDPYQADLNSNNKNYPEKDRAPA